MPPEAMGPVRGALRLRLLLATVLGIGYAPIAPGTFGSGPGVLLAWILVWSGGISALGVGIAVVVVVGWWAADGAAAHLGLRDPGLVVVDEVAGQMVALVGIAPTPATLVASFLLFRLFDILKPFPARQLEALPGGFGIMADDLAAGVYANAVLQGLIAVLPSVLELAGAR
jgi:phosphatidylglycerophosphatase A